MIELRENTWTILLFAFFVAACGGALAAVWLDDASEPFMEWGLLVCFPFLAALLVKVWSHRVTISDDGIRAESLPLPVFGPARVELPWADVALVTNGRSVKMPGAIGEMLRISGADERPGIAIASTMRGFDRAVDMLEDRVPGAFDASARQVVEKRKRTLARRAARRP